MITNETIDKVLDLDIEQVISKKVTLKKQGANFQGCCPFHDENTPSFVVSVSKGIYKCFGCGVSGNVISFVMEYEKMSYPEAIKWLGKEFNITIEETRDQDEDAEVKEKRAIMQDMNKDALKRYREAFLKLPDDHWAKQYIYKIRRIKEDAIAEFQICYAPEQWDFLTKKIVDAGLFAYGEELGLIRRKEQHVHDFFHNKVMFPIHNERGEVVGFTGRKKEDNKKETPKYVNSQASMVFRKDQTLYGLYQAQREIRKKQFAILVEGNIDVVAMHQAGARNTVAPGGTAFTESQAQKLLKYTSHLVIMFDGDDAGKAATIKAIDIAIIAGFTQVEVVPMDNGQDPDELVQFLTAPLQEKKRTSSKKASPKAAEATT